MHHCPLVLYPKGPQSNDRANVKGRSVEMQLLTRFAPAAAHGIAHAASLRSANPLVAGLSHSYKATTNGAAKRTAWYSAFGAAATGSPIS